MIFPWQQKEWQILMHAAHTDRLPHALLFLGISGLGKAVFADCLARSLLCNTKNSDNSACGECHACRLVEGKVHPNVLWISPDGAAIKVDQIREINEFLNLSGLQGDYRIVIIHHASAMNTNAANAMLKILEEPTPNALMLLLSETERLPMTIKSRCQRIIFPIPQRVHALNWLKSKLPAKTSIDADLLLNLAQGAPLKALLLAKEENTLKARQELLNAFYLLSQKQADPIASAALLQEFDTRMLIDITLSWVIDLLRVKCMSSTADMHDADSDNVSKFNLTNSDYSEQLEKLSTRIAYKKIIRFMDELQKLRTHLLNGINLNKLLLMETILIRWLECA